VQLSSAVIENRTEVIPLGAWLKATFVLSKIDIQGLQLALGRTAELQWLPPQPGDVPSRGWLSIWRRIRLPRPSESATLSWRSSCSAIDPW